MPATIPPMSAVAHYHAAAQFWESRAKSLQGLVDQQDAVITELRERLSLHEPPDETAETPVDPAAA